MTKVLYSLLTILLYMGQNQMLPVLVSCHDLAVAMIGPPAGDSLGSSQNT